MLSRTLSSRVLYGLFEESHFKKAQLDSLLVKRYARKNGMAMEEALGLRDRRASLGSTERSALQAERVISKSLATLALALRLDLLHGDALNSVYRIAGVLRESEAQNLTEEQAEQLMRLIRAILRQSSRK